MGNIVTKFGCQMLSSTKIFAVGGGLKEHGIKVSFSDKYIFSCITGYILIIR
jgi:hypothetical protein